MSEDQITLTETTAPQPPATEGGAELPAASPATLTPAELASLNEASMMLARYVNRAILDRDPAAALAVASEKLAGVDSRVLRYAFAHSGAKQWVPELERLAGELPDEKLARVWAFVLAAYWLGYGEGSGRRA